jgi:hypothetical protein
MEGVVRGILASSVVMVLKARMFSGISAGIEVLAGRVSLGIVGPKKRFRGGLNKVALTQFFRCQADDELW